MDASPDLSILIATRNRAGTLGRTLESVLTTVDPGAEIIVVDGASTDGTVALLQSYGERIRWISEPDAGEYDAFNKAARLATGQILKFLPDDDELRPEGHLEAMRWMQAHEDVDIGFGRTTVWNDDETPPRLVRTTRVDDVRFGASDWFRHRTGVYSVAAYIRREVFERIGYFDTRYKCGDTEFWIRAARAGIRFGAIPAIVVDYHLTGQNGITKHSRQIAKDLVHIAVEQGTLEDIQFMATWMGPRALGVEPQVARVFDLARRYNIHPFQKLRAWRAKT